MALKQLVKDLFVPANWHGALAAAAASIDANCARHIARHLAIQNVVNFCFFKKNIF